MREAAVPVIDGVRGKDNTAVSPKCLKTPPVAFDELIAGRIGVGGNLVSGPDVMGCFSRLRGDSLLFVLS